MSNYLRAVDLEKTRIGSEAMDHLCKEGWDLLCRLLPTEYDAGGDVLRNWFVMKKRGASGSPGEIDLTEVWNKIEGLDNAIDVIGQVHDQIWVALEKCGTGGAENTPPFEFDFEIWTCTESSVLPVAEGGISGKLGIVDGDRLCARFSIDNAALIPAKASLYIVPEASVQPSGYAPFFPGVFVHNCQKHGWMLNGIARWHRRNEFGDGKQGIRMQYSNFDLVREINYPRDQDGHELHNVVLPSWAPGGDWYAMRRSEVLTTFGGDTFEVEVQLPRF